MSLRIVLKAQPKTRRTRSQPFFHRCREPVYTVVFQSVVCPDLTSDQAFFLSLSLSLGHGEKRTPYRRVKLEPLLPDVHVTLPCEKIRSKVNYDIKLVLVFQGL